MGYDYKIKFVNVDDKVTKLSQRALEALEFVWLPFSVSKDSHGWWPVSSGISRLPIESPLETVGSGSGYGSDSFEMEVRTTIHPVSMSIKAVTGKPVYPVCTLEGKHISTFDNRTTKADMDDCFHLLSGDCSKAMSYGVLVRSLESSG